MNFWKRLRRTGNVLLAAVSVLLLIVALVKQASDSTAVPGPVVADKNASGL